MILGHTGRCNFSSRVQEIATDRFTKLQTNQQTDRRAPREVTPPTIHNVINQCHERQFWRKKEMRKNVQNGAPRRGGGRRSSPNLNKLSIVITITISTYPPPSPPLQPWERPCFVICHGLSSIHKNKRLRLYTGCPILLVRSFYRRHNS